jgi:uncharacterized membrane protein YecN with MAPEG domain
VATVTALYASILAIIVTALGINVTVWRARLQVSLGDGGKPQMLRMIRMHGNAAEYVPLALALMLVYEINGGFLWLLHGVGIALIVGRLLQTWGMWTSDMPGFGRGAGQTLTWLSVAVLAAANILRVL